MPKREPLRNGKTYHIFNKSIFHFTVFNNKYEYEHMLLLIRFYQFAHTGRRGRFSYYYKNYLQPNNLCWNEDFFVDKEKVVDVLAYCLMPTHIHFALRQKCDGGINQFMHRLLNSYSHYFNLRYDRRGPLWQNRFKDVLVDGGDHLDRLISYIHQNPVKAKLVKKAGDWPYSSLAAT